MKNPKKNVEFKLLPNVKINFSASFFLMFNSHKLIASNKGKKYSNYWVIWGSKCYILTISALIEERRNGKNKKKPDMIGTVASVSHLMVYNYSSIKWFSFINGLKKTYTEIKRAYCRFTFFSLTLSLLSFYHKPKNFNHKMLKKLLFKIRLLKLIPGALIFVLLLQ